MEITETIQSAYHDYDMLARDPDYHPTDTRALFVKSGDIDAFAGTLDMRFVNVVNQVGRNT